MPVGLAQPFVTQRVVEHFLLLAPQVLGGVFEPGQLVHERVALGLKPLGGQLPPRVLDALPRGFELLAQPLQVALPGRLRRGIHLRGCLGHALCSAVGLETFQSPRQASGLLCVQPQFFDDALDRGQPLGDVGFRGGLCNLLQQAVLLPGQLGKFLLGLLEPADQAFQFGLAAVGEDVEHLVEILHDLLVQAALLRIDDPAEAVFPQVAAAGTHRARDAEAAGLGQRVGHRIGRQRIAGPQCRHGLFHVLLDAVEPAGELKLRFGQIRQVADLLRAEFLQLPRERRAREFDSALCQLLLIAEQLRHVAVEAAVALALVQLPEKCLDGGNHLVLICARVGQIPQEGRIVLRRPGRRRFGRLKISGRGGQSAVDGGKVVALQAIDFVQDVFHAALHVGTVDVVVLQLGQRGQRVHAHAFAGTGQAAVDFALRQFGGAELVDRAGFEGFLRGQLFLDGGDLPAAAFLHL